MVGIRLYWLCFLVLWLPRRRRYQCHLDFVQMSNKIYCFMLFFKTMRSCMQFAIQSFHLQSWCHVFVENRYTWEVAYHTLAH